MNRILSLATAGLFTTGLAVMPLAAYAQATSTTPDAKAGTTAAVTAPAQQAGKTAHAHAKGATHHGKVAANKSVSKASTAAKSGSKATTTTPAPKSTQGAS
jgi:hypothetical protein